MTATARAESPSQDFDMFAPLFQQLADPLGFEAGDENLYRYVGNGPTNAVDPSGLVWTHVPGFGKLVSSTLELKPVISLGTGSLNPAIQNLHPADGILILRKNTYSALYSRTTTSVFGGTCVEWDTKQWTEVEEWYNPIHSNTVILMTSVNITPGKYNVGTLNLSIYEFADSNERLKAERLMQTFIKSLSRPTPKSVPKTFPD